MRKFQVIVIICFFLTLLATTQGAAPVIGGTYTVSIDEELPIGTTVHIPFTATDSDGDVLIYILTGTTYFQIDSGTGAIAITKVIDFDGGQTSFTFMLVVADNESTPNTATQTLTVTINNINDNSPVFAPSLYFASVQENNIAGHQVAMVTVTDSDPSDTINLSIQSGDDTLSKFTISSKSIVTSTTPIDYDSLGGKNFMYTLVVIAVDSGSPTPLTGTASVFVTITSQNEAAPIWQTFSPVYNPSNPYTVAENIAAGTTVVTISASDADAGVDGDVTYVIGGSLSTSGQFHLDGVTGTLTISTNSLDRDTATGGSEHFDILVKAVDQAASPLSATTTIRVMLTDVNDNAPVCTSGTFTATVSENVANGNSVLTILATDNDATTANNVITYSVSGGSGVALFVADTTTGLISTSSYIDYETATTYDIEVTVTDSGTPPLSSTCIARITIDDMNDNTPTFSASSLTVSVPENQPIGYVVATAHATDLDSSINSNNVIVYSFSSISTDFSIGPSTGVITTTTNNDREQGSSYILVVLAKDLGTAQNTGTITYTILITDLNDNPPVITGTYDSSVDEDAPLNFVLFTIAATDADDAQNSVLSYAITNGNTNSVFAMDSGSGLMQVRKSLDRETIDLYLLEITVTDSGNAPMSASITATVTIGDINDNNPIFSMMHYSFTVSESATIGTSVNTAAAIDADAGVNSDITYSVAFFVTGDSSHFSLVSTSGVINTAGELDREKADTYLMVIRAIDSGTRALTGTATVTVSILDYNDNTPTFSAGLYAGTITEKEAIGSSILVVTATDLDTGVNADVVFSIDTSTTAGARADLYIVADSGTSTLNVKQLIDRETDPTFVFNLVATDRGTPAMSSTAIINITVYDVNDNPPIFSAALYSTEIAYNDDCQLTVVTITASDADIGVNADVTYAISQNNYSGIFTLNGNSGDVTIQSQAVTDTKYVIYALASDAGTPTLSSTTDVAVRIDSYNPNVVIINYHMDINCSTYLIAESTFLTQLTAVYQATYVSPEAKRWCTAQPSSSTCVVRVYVVKDNSADELSELTNAKNFLTMDEAFEVTSENASGTPASVISGALWTSFSITKVEKYYKAPTSESSTSWFESTTGVAVMTSVGVAALIAILAGFSLAFYYKYKKPTKRVGALGGNKVSNKKMFQNDYYGHKKGSMPRVAVNDPIEPKSKADNVSNRQFDGRALDPVTGRVYQYNTKSGDRSWIRTPSGDPNLIF